MGAFDDLIPKVSLPLPQAPKSGAFADLIPVQNTPLAEKFKKTLSAPPLMARAAQLPADVAKRGDGFRITGADIAKMLEPEIAAASEVAPAVPSFIPFNAATNMAIQAQKTGANIPELLRAGVEALPFGKAVKTAVTKGPRAVLEQDSLTAPENLRPPRELLINAMKALDPSYKAPEGFLANTALDIGAGLLTGAPQAAAIKASEAAAQSDLKAALEALKANPERKLRILSKGLKRMEQQAPKALPAPDNLGEGFERVPQPEATRRIKEYLRQQVQTGTSGPKNIPSAALVETGAKLNPIESYFTPQKGLDESGRAFEDQALKFFKEQPEEAVKAYRDRVLKEFGTDRVVSGDEAKFIVPGVKTESMAHAHEPASAFAKVYGDALLSNPETKGKPVMIMAGGSGSGKTRAVRETFKNLESDYAGVFDTNSNNLAAVEKNIAKIKKSGRPVEVVYVERDPLEAWRAVIERGKKTGRPVPADIHIKNQGSRETVKELIKLYKADPDVKVTVLLNKTGEEAKSVPLADFLKKRYTSFGTKQLKGKLDEELNQQIKAGNLTEEQALSYRFREEKPGPGKSVQESNPLNDQGSIPGQLQEKSVNPLENQQGFARIKKNLSGMTEAEQRAEIARLREKAIAGGDKELKFIQTVRNAPNTSEEVGQKILGTYKPITNAETLAKANARVSKSVDEALAFVKATRAPTAESNATAQLLIDKFQNEGNFNQAIDIVEDIAAKATKQGQAIQALSMYSKLSPEGVLRYAQRQFDKAAEELTGKARPTPEEIAKLPAGVQKKLQKLKLTPQVAQKLTAQAKAVQGSGTPRQRAINTARTLATIQSQLPVSFWDKISSAQTIAQLLNPKTAIRNTVGNIGFAGLENVSDAVAAGFDKAVSIATGRRSKVLPSLKIQARGAAKGAREAMQDIKAGIRTSPANTQFQLPQAGIFKSRVGQALEKSLRYELEVSDRAAFTATYRQSLWNQMRAAGAKRYTPEMVEKAVHDGLYRTFQDDNAISVGFSKIKRALNTVSSKVTGTERFGLGDAVIKYPKTPGAILDRGIDYSPAGFFKTVLELTKPLAGKSFDQKAFVESAARAFVGTNLVGTGIILAKLGIITGRKDDKPGIRDLKREVGLGNYKINTSGLKRFVMSGFDPQEAKLQKGDHLETYDWFQPQAIDIAIGANIEENKGKATGTVGTIAEAIGSGTSTLADQPLVSGVSRMFARGDVVEGLGETMKGIPSSFVPTLLNQTRTLVDDVRRNSADENPFQESLNLVKMKIPGLSKDLPEKTEPLGGTSRIFKAGEGPLEKAFDVYLNPSNSSRYGTDPSTDQAAELIRLDVPVGKQGKTLKGIDITNQERAAIDKMTGPMASRLLKLVINAPGYKQLDDLKKQKVLEATVEKSKTVAQASNVSNIARRLIGKPPKK